jgi:hypothetical protein
VPPSSGYDALSKLLLRREVRTVLTTNFDSLIADTARTYTIHQIDEIKTKDDQRKFSVDPAFPQVVYLHGSVDHYTDKNLEVETRTLEDSLVDLLRPLLRDHPLIVVGYRGGEPSIMSHLLSNQAAACAGYRHGIYWCYVSSAAPFKPSPLFRELQDAINGNLQLVEIEGFDELMCLLENLRQLDGIANAGLKGADDRLPVSALDLEAAARGLDILSRSLLTEKLVAYCDSQRLPRPRLETDEDLLVAMEAQNLALRQDGAYTITKSAQLLFAKEPQFQLPGAHVEVSLSGPSEWMSAILGEQAASRAESVTGDSVVLAGNLWGQLENASDLLARVNRPFRLKTASSQDVYPYPPLALKELLTNLLAHRDYRHESAANIEISPESICFRNAGGLVEVVQRQVGESGLQDAVGLGVGRVKGYRNPVVAELFYSSGAMDKEGSGLHDVLIDAANNLNKITFGPTPDNTTFVATIKIRPEALAVDQKSNTAKPSLGELRYSPNLLRILSWPAEVSKLGSVATIQELSKAEKVGAAPFFAYREWVWTFASLDEPSVQPLRALAMEEEVSRVPVTEMLSARGAATGLPRLLNAALAAHLASLGMRVRWEAGGMRAYFPSEDGAPREIAYRSQFKAARRTVTKPVMSRSTGQCSYWEHKAVALRFERFNDEWALSLVPAYAFTQDGDSKDIAPERLGILSTRRASRDYNPTVLHDVVFWARMISQTGEPTFKLPLSAPGPGSAPPAVEVEAMIPTLVFQEAVDAAMTSVQPAEVPEVEIGELQDEIEHLLSEQQQNGPHSSQ